MDYTSGGPLGFPDDESAELLERITDTFNEGTQRPQHRTADGHLHRRRTADWVFYTFSTEVFHGFLDRALAPFPLLPLHITAENDPDWAEYDEMRSITADAMGSDPQGTEPANNL